jgi:Protein of unknown function (DUF3054)
MGKRWLIAGDLLAIFIFVFVGRETHDLAGQPNALLALALTVGEFWLPWLLVGWLGGAFGPPGDRLRGFLARTGVAWLGAAPLGVLLRALVLGRDVIPPAFLAVTLGVGGAFVLAWRLVFWFVIRRRMP